MIYREHYISQVREFYDSDLIKIITGIRRSGKSVILEQIKDEIKKTSDLEVKEVNVKIKDIVSEKEENVKEPK